MIKDQMFPPVMSYSHDLEKSHVFNTNEQMPVEEILLIMVMPKHQVESIK